MARMMILLATLLLTANAFAPPNVDMIIRRSVEANNIDWEAAPQYNHFERDRSGGGTRTYEVMMILGSEYQRLVAVNGTGSRRRSR